MMTVVKTDASGFFVMHIEVPPLSSIAKQHRLSPFLSLSLSLVFDYNH